MSIYTIRAGADAMPETSFLQMLTDLLEEGGVEDLENDFVVTEKGAGADMSVDVSAGRAFVLGASNAYPVRSTATENVEVTANSSGNPRIDSLVLYIDIAASTNTDASNVAKLAVVAGTPAASPVAPTDGAIQTAIGASNPFLRLSNFNVENLASEIEDADITQTTSTFLLKNRSRVIPVAYGASIELDLKGRNTLFMVSGLTGNPTLTVDNVRDGNVFLVRLVQDGTGGRTVTWFSGIAWENGIVPTLSAGANKVDIFGFIALTPTVFYGFTVAQNI